MTSGKPSILALTECTVELALTWETNAQGGVDFKVLKLAGERSRTEMQTITLVMKPLDSDSGPEGAELHESRAYGFAMPGPGPNS